jgi:hypothetical protein
MDPEVIACALSFTSPNATKAGFRLSKPATAAAPCAQASRNVHLLVRELAHCHRPQSSSASLFIAGALGFFGLIQSGERPE